MPTQKNFEGKCIGKIDFYCSGDKREIGDKVFINLMEDGKVLIYSPAVRVKETRFTSKVVKGIFDHIFPSIEEAKKYFTCTKSTDFDVYGAWSKMMSDRYW